MENVTPPKELSKVKVNSIFFSHIQMLDYYMLTKLTNKEIAEFLTELQ